MTRHKTNPITSRMTTREPRPREWANLPWRSSRPSAQGTAISKKLPDPVDFFFFFEIFGGRRLSPPCYFPRVSFSPRFLRGYASPLFFPCTSMGFVFGSRPPGRNRLSTVLVFQESRSPRAGEFKKLSAWRLNKRWGSRKKCKH